MDIALNPTVIGRYVIETGFGGSEVLGLGSVA